MSVVRQLAVLCCALLVSALLVVAAPFLAGPAAAATELLVDGGFESSTATDPPTSPGWTESDNRQGAFPGSPLCPSSNCSISSVYTPPHSGSFWARFGGPVTTFPHLASLSQSVTIPAGGSAVLTYWYRNGRVASPFTATLQVKVDGTVVKTHVEASTADSAYSQQSVNLSAYANGGSHTLSFSYVNNDGGDNRMGVDDISLTYTPPVVTTTPTVTSTTPASPSSSTTPLVKGTTEPGSTVTLYANSSCTTALGSGSAAAFAGSGIPVSVPANATTTIYAKATKSGQVNSACSSTFVSYTTDSIAPALVTMTAVAPGATWPTTTPSVTGTAEAGSTVRLYSTVGCAGSPVATGSAAAFASPGLTPAVTIGSTTTFRARATDAAGNISACSTSAVTFTSDMLDGGFEATVGTDSPYWAEADSLAGSPLCTSCAGTSPHSGRAWAWFGGFADAGHTGGLTQVLTIPVGTKSLTYWYENLTVSDPFDAQLVIRVDGTTVKSHTEATVADSAYARQFADISAFADGGVHVLSFSYTNGGAGVNNMLVDDLSLSALTVATTATPTVAPATVPASGSTSTTTRVTGTAEAGATVTLYGNAACSGTPLGTGSAASFTSPGIVATVPANTTTAIHALATKAGQDDSACSTTAASYTQQDPASAPETFLTKTPHKKVWTHRRSTKVAFLFSASTVGAAFQCSIDGKAFAACTPGHRFRLKLGKHTFAVRAVAQGLVDPTPATFKVKVKRRR